MTYWTCPGCRNRYAVPPGEAIECFCAWDGLIVPSPSGVTPETPYPGPTFRGSVPPPTHRSPVAPPPDGYSLEERATHCTPPKPPDDGKKDKSCEGRSNMPKHQLVTIKEATKIVGRKHSTISSWVCLGYIEPFGTSPRKGSTAKLYRLSDIMKISARMPGALGMRKPPEGYVTATEAGVIMGRASQSVLGMFRRGEIAGTAISWGARGNRRFVFILKSAAVEYAQKNKKPIKFEKAWTGGRAGIYDRTGMSADAMKKQVDPVIERPLIYFRDSICLAARRAKFEEMLSKPLPSRSKS